MDYRHPCRAVPDRARDTERGRHRNGSDDDRDHVGATKRDHDHDVRTPLQTMADAQDAIESNRYAVAVVMARRLGKEDLVRRRIANQIARRVVAAVRGGDRSRASFLLQQADKYPSTNAVAQARTTYVAAKQRAADRAQSRRATAEQAAAEQKAQEAADAAPEPEPSSDSCDPGYSGCVPAYPPDVNCPGVDGPVQVTGSDPHGLDRDGDGVACE